METRCEHGLYPVSLGPPSGEAADTFGRENMVRGKKPAF